MRVYSGCMKRFWRKLWRLGSGIFDKEGVIRSFKCGRVLSALKSRGEMSKCNI